MNQLRQTLALIKARIGSMSATSQLLLASLAIILVMGLFLVSQYAGTPTMVELMPDDAGARRVGTLQAAGISASSINGRVMVPESDRLRAIALLSESGAMPDDTAVFFANYIQSMDWKNSREQNQQIYNLALQNELGRVISRFRGVKSASVIIDPEEGGGLGQARKSPTAAATVFNHAGTPLTQDTVDAVAGLLAGAVSGLEASNVRVIDGSTGRQRKPTDEGEILPTVYLEQAANAEARTQRKLSELLAHIPGVVVAVTAEVDVTRVRTDRSSVLPKGAGSESFVSSETTDSENSSQRQTGGEAGVRSNQTASINTGSSASGTSFDKSNEKIEFDNQVGREQKTIIDPRGAPTRLAASINIPQGYIEKLVRRSKEMAAGGAGDARGEAGADVTITEPEVQDRFAQLRPQIEEALKPHLDTRLPDGTLTEGEVRVSMIPVSLEELAPPAPVQAGMMSSLGLGSGGDGGGMMKTIIVAALAVVALGLMVMMAKKGAKQMDLPTPEELVGLPPKLEADSDIVGEADESTAPLAGIELGEDDIKSQMLLEQVGQMVANDPEAAARLVGRWIESED